MYEDFKAQHEEQLDSLREALKKERLQSGSLVEEQVNFLPFPNFPSSSFWRKKEVEWGKEIASN